MIKNTFLFENCLFLVLSIAGVFMARGQWLRVYHMVLFPVFLSVVQFPVLTDGRYSLPMVPMMVIFAAFAAPARVGGADVILVTSNSTDAMADSIQGLRPDGRFVAMGFDPKPLQLSLADLITRRIRIMGSQQNGPEYLLRARGKEPSPIPRRRYRLTGFGGCAEPRRAGARRRW